jgi:RNA polymerase sigma-70 factor (ECF subfamily)
LSTIMLINALLYIEEKIRDWSGRAQWDAVKVQETINGNKDSFAELIDSYLKLYNSIGYGFFFRDKEILEDAIQESVLNIYEALPRLEQPEKFGSWSYTIVKRTCLKLKTDIKRENTELAEMSREPKPPIHQVEKIRLEEIETILRKLPLKYREVMILHFLNNLTVDQVAETLEISRENVETRIFRARKMLRERLGDL